MQIIRAMFLEVFLLMIKPRFPSLFISSFDLYTTYVNLSNQFLWINRNLQCSLQINHVHQLNTGVIYRVIIIICKEIFYTVRTNKSTIFIKRNCKWTVSGSNLKNRILFFIFRSNKVNQSFSISFSLILRNSGNIINFKNAVPLIGNNALTFHTIIN